ncbi:MAG: hypothetical protein OXP28_17840 [Gammaproteobacteria bacterium]|nr:hypothetical protein [Gammaproteobacteria bacterium]
MATGALLWRRRVGRHATSSATGSPALHDGQLFVPISSSDSVVAADPHYECCTASGAVLCGSFRAILKSRERTRSVPGSGPLRVPRSGPAPRSTPRGRNYAGTGQNYTRPATGTSDAIIALDIGTGKLAWSFQATVGNAWKLACQSRPHGRTCPDPPGPDHDFGMSPMLVARPDGKEILVAGQKSGTVWALEPDDDGAILWSTQVGKGGALGGIH